VIPLGGGSGNLPNTAWPDESLVRECLAGNEEAWSALVAKYKKLIYSVPVKFGFSREEASDIFQEVCLTLLGELPRLRDPKRLGAWLIRVASNACFHSSRRERRYEPFSERDEPWQDQYLPGLPDRILREAEREQILRDALAQARPRCRELIHMLFFEVPPLPYEQVARKLSVAQGSIGFIRMRCLQSLRKLLEDRGF
jgi:RNA polymerase sigma factor (sigma-70 family)